MSLFQNIFGSHFFPIRDENGPARPGPARARPGPWAGPGRPLTFFLRAGPGRAALLEKRAGPGRPVHKNNFSVSTKFHQ